MNGITGTLLNLSGVPKNDYRLEEWIIINERCNYFDIINENNKNQTAKVLEKYFYSVNGICDYVSVVQDEIEEYIVKEVAYNHGKISVYLQHEWDRDKTCYSATVYHEEDFDKIFTDRKELEAIIKKESFTERVNCANASIVEDWDVSKWDFTRCCADPC